jgi:hypothetical protein
MRLPNWTGIQWTAVLTTLVGVGLCLLTCAMILYAIFVDRAPTEGNVGGASVVVGVVGVIIFIIGMCIAEDEF